MEVEGGMMEVEGKNEVGKLLEMKVMKSNRGLCEVLITR